MTGIIALDDNQIDQLKELCNLAMGDGAKALASYTQRFVVLTVPQVNSLGIDELPRFCRYAVAGQTAHAVLQRFSCLGQEAEILLLLSQEYLREFARLLDREFQDEADQESLLSQLAGLINPVILPRVAKELKIVIKLGAIETCCQSPAQDFNFAPLLSRRDAYNLCFSYALEEPLSVDKTHTDCLANYHVAKSQKPAMALDVIIRGPLSLAQSLSEKFAARLEA